MALSYCDLVIFYNYFTIPLEIHTHYIPSIRLGHSTYMGRCHVPWHKDWQKRAVQSPPTPNQQLILSYPKNLVSLLQLNKFLLSYSNSVHSPNPLQLLTLAWSMLGNMSFSPHPAFPRIISIKYRSSACTQTKRSQSRCNWGPTLTCGIRHRSHTALHHRYHDMSSAHRVYHEVLLAEASEVFLQKWGRGDWEACGRPSDPK